ncbi:MAG: LytR/AlgR family response regulator transcription factor [Sporichthyaceae bacterium]
MSDRAEPGAGLTVLAVDDEPPALSELSYLLGRDPRVGRVLTAGSSAEAQRVLAESEPDAVFLDIRMPGRSGVDLARSLATRPDPPALVFVTAYDAHAVAAFDLDAVDYVLKPIRPDRLAEAVRRIAAQHPPSPPQPANEPVPASAAEPIAIELAGVTRFVHRADVRYVQAHGDYARLHTAGGTHLVRIPMATLAERWAQAGFVRIHRSYLVALAHVEEVRMSAGRASVVLGGTELPVSRRHTRALREVLARRSVRADTP